MSLATRSNTAARRSSGALSSCPGGVRDSPGRPLDTARRAGRAACVPRIAVDPAGWSTGPRSEHSEARTGSTPRWSDSDSELPVRRPKAALRTPPNRRTSETQRVQGTTKGPSDATTTTGHAATLTPQALPATSAIAHRTLSTPHARATSCPMSTCRHVSWF